MASSSHRKKLHLRNLSAHNPPTPVQTPVTVIKSEQSDKPKKLRPPTELLSVNKESKNSDEDSANLHPHRVHRSFDYPDSSNSKKSSTAVISEHFSHSAPISEFKTAVLPTLAIVTSAVVANPVQIALIGGDSKKKQSLWSADAGGIENIDGVNMKLDCDIYQCMYSLEFKQTSDASIILYLPGAKINLEKTLMNYFESRHSKIIHFFEIEYINPEDSQLAQMKLREQFTRRVGKTMFSNTVKLLEEKEGIPCDLTTAERRIQELIMTLRTKYLKYVNKQDEPPEVEFVPSRTCCI